LDRRGTVLESNRAFDDLMSALGRRAPRAGDSYLDLLRSSLTFPTLQAEAIEDKLTYLALEDAPGLAFVREVGFTCGGRPHHHRIQMVQWGGAGNLMVMHVDLTEARRAEKRAELELDLVRALSRYPDSQRAHHEVARTFALDLGALACVFVPADARGRLGAAERVHQKEAGATAEPIRRAPPEDSVVGTAIRGRAPVVAGPSSWEQALARSLGTTDLQRCCVVPSVRQGHVEGAFLFLLSHETESELEHLSLVGGILGVGAEEGGAAEGGTEQPASIPPPASTDLDAMASLASETDAPVLLLGESGVGKTRLAREIHRRSRRADAPFLDLNCAGLSPELLESELFGHERGAFTGAHARKLGLLEKAHGGTVLLDEVGELDLTVQAKLLKVIESRTFRRVGGQQETAVDVRFVSATHRDLWARVHQGAFREDLLYRLNVVQIVVPSLRETPWRIPTLAATILRDVGARDGRQLSLTPAAELLLMQQRWRGNIRELANVLARASLGARSSVDERRVRFAIGDEPASSRTDAAGSLADSERAAIESALEATGFTIKRAAEMLGIARSTLYDKIGRYDIDVEAGRRRQRGSD